MLSVAFLASPSRRAAMWLATNLFVARAGVAASTSEAHWLGDRFRLIGEAIAVWRRRAREREELRRYLHYEMKKAPDDFPKDAWSESAKWFWEV
jgi:hypothetical protein